MSHNIKLKDNQGNDVTYNDVSQINLLDTSGNEVVFSEKKTEQTKTVTPTTSEQVVIPDENHELSQVTVEAIQTEEKTVTKNGEYTPSEGKYLSKVNVNVEDVQPTLQEKTVNPTTSEQNIVADEEYYGLSKVIVEAVNPSDYYKPEETLDVTPTTSAQIINPSEGKVFNQINVNAIQTEEKTATSNGDVVPSDGKYLTKVSVNVQPNLGTKTITENGTYAASDDEVDGYSSVTVNVESSGVRDQHETLYEIKAIDNIHFEIKTKTYSSLPTYTEYLEQEEYINNKIEIITGVNFNG